MNFLFMLCHGEEDPKFRTFLVENVSVIYCIEPPSRHVHLQFSSGVLDYTLTEKKK